MIMCHVNCVRSGLVFGARAVCDKFVRPADDPAVLYRQNLRAGRRDQITSAVNRKPASTGRAKMRIFRIRVPRYGGASAERERRHKGVSLKSNLWYHTFARAFMMVSRRRPTSIEPALALREE